ncbi:MAG: 23S rRNA (uracil(1939)-C(5))-methyltransferase RlmD, partial [Clostridia bacterium]|nr:23S rRNA (uracil(1939)-C(5))-methyltransferase RlmD [Clostridia bacterium]
MQKNDVLPLRAENLGAEMEGVCRIDGMPVFVPGLLPGEEALVRILKTEKRYAFGRMEASPTVSSPHRIPSDCPAFPQCGGCTARHMDYSFSLEAKRQHIQDCFQRIGHLSVTVPPVLGMNHPYAYRNKTALPIGGTPENPVLGFYAPRSHRLIPMPACPNAMPPAGEIAKAIQSWMKDSHLAPYDEVNRHGIFRHLVIRVNRKQEAMVTLVVSRQNIPDLNNLYSRLTSLGVVSLFLNVNRRDTNVIFGDEFHLICGRETLPDTLCGLRFELSPASFFQINPEQTEILYATALRFADLRPDDALTDVYCGAGTISLMMARHCRKVTGIEVVPSAVLNARENAQRNGIQNASFLEGKAENLLPRMVQEGHRPSVIVVDPPRKGLEPSVIDAMAEASPDRLVYVSCNPSTLARDAALLHERNYTIRQIQPVDMFPWTS